MTNHQNFFENFYLLFNQPDIDKIIYIIKGIWNIDNPWSVLQYLDNHLAKNSNGLNKATFEHELLKLRLSDYVVSPTAVMTLQHPAVDEWNRLTLKQDVTIVQNETNIEPYLFCCMLQNISNIITVEEWNYAVNNVGKLDRDLKNRLKATSFKANTLKELICQAWADRKTPLLLKTDASLPFLKEFSHLGKCYVIIDSNLDRRYEEIESYKLSGFRYLRDVQARRLMEAIPVSLQGRKPVSLGEIIENEEMLKQSVTCRNIINLIKPREAYLKRDSLKGSDYMLCIVETANPGQHSDDEYQATGNNMAVYCEPNESESYYSKHRSDPRFKNYKFVRTRLIDDDKLQLISKIKGQYEEDYRGLESFFVDQNGESVYYMADGTIVPVVGEVPTRTGTHFHWRYIPRHLHKGIIKKDEGTTSNEDASSKCSIEYSGKRLADKDILKNSSNKITVVTGEPGMGKTTLLHSLFNWCESKYYVLFVDLARIRSDLLSGKIKSSPHLLNLFRNKCRFLPYSCFLNSVLDSTNRLVLILDSFDEVVATCKRQILELIKSLQEIGPRNIIIASRLTAIDLLLHNFQTDIFKVEDLNEQSEHYIGNWDLDTNSLRHIPSEFLTNPLYLNMLKTISENGINLEVVNRWNLYEGILKLRLENYCQQKKCDENEEQYILGKHGELALKVVFGSNKVTEKQQKKNRRVPPNYSHFIRLGFVTSYDKENPIFVHRTFAEFFVAKWLMMNIDDHDGADIYRLMLENEQAFVLNIHSETFPLHKAVIDCDAWKVKRLIKENTNCLLEIDGLGRNVLHLATIVCPRWNKDILEILMQSMRKEEYDVYVRDKIIGWTWIDYIGKYSWLEFRYLPITIKEAYLNYYATHTEELERCMYSLSDNFINLYDEAVCLASISLIRDLLFLKYHKNNAFLEFREMCLGSRKIRVSQIELSEEKLEGVHLVCIYGNIEGVQVYIGSGENFTKADKFNCTPLHYGVMAEQRIEIVKLLLDTYGISNLYPGPSRYNETTILHISARTGDVNVARMILERVDDRTIKTLMEQHDNKQCTPLSLAIEYDNNDMVELLLQYRANPSFRPYIIQAVDGRNEGIVQMLLNYGAQVNANESLIYSAIQTSEIDVIEILFRNGANVNHVDRSGWTPLTYAISLDSSNIVQILLNYEADTNLKGGNGEIPLFMAIDKNNLKIIELLLANKARLDCLDSDGYTPLIYAIVEEKKNIVKMLSTGVNFKGTHGITPLHIAITEENGDIVQILLDHQADMNSVDEYGLSPLITAIIAENAQITEMLLNEGVDVNFVNEFGLTALYVAAFRGSVTMVELLLRHGADVNAIAFGEEILRKVKSAKKIEAFLAMLQNRNIGHVPSGSNSTAMNIIEKVTENWANISLENELRAAVGQQLVDFDTINMLMETGGEIDIDDEFWKAVFCLINEINNKDVDNAFFRHLGCFKPQRLMEKVCSVTSDRNIDIIKILLRHHKSNFLRTAIKFKNKEIVQIVLQNADMRSITWYVDSPLHSAVHQQSADIVQLLLKHGFTIYREDFEGLTPFIVAVATGNVAIAEMLLNEGAVLNFKLGDSGVTALHIAALKENRSMVRMLLKRRANRKIGISGYSLLSKMERIEVVYKVKFSTYNPSEIIKTVKRIIEEVSKEIDIA